VDAARARRDYRTMALTQRAGEDAGRSETAPGVMAPAAPRPPRPPRPRGSFRRDVRRALREPFTRRTARECLYAGLSLLMAIPLFAFTAVALAVGLGLSVSFAGLPLLALTLRAARPLGGSARPAAAWRTGR
jgi:Putative sensor